MKTAKDYHIHSIYSKNGHGKSTIEEIVKHSVEIGLKEIAITDHGTAHFLYGINKNKILQAKAEVKEMRKKYPQIKILFGVEANIINLQGDTDIDDKITDNCDILLCGYHAGVVFSTIKDAWSFYVLNLIGKFCSSVKKRQTKKNTEAIVGALNKYNINILTHPGDKIPVDIDKIAKAAAENNTILEINNSHGHLNVNDLKIASKYNVKFAINSDAHHKDKIGGCQNGIEIAVASGIDLNRIVNLE